MHDGTSKFFWIDDFHDKMMFHLQEPCHYLENPVHVYNFVLHGGISKLFGKMICSKDHVTSSMVKVTVHKLCG